VAALLASTGVAALLDLDAAPVDLDAVLRQAATASATDIFDVGAAELTACQAATASATDISDVGAAELSDLSAFGFEDDESAPLRSRCARSSSRLCLKSDS
jgi:hypothetical protein